jgi:hypothetical protein
MHLAPRVRPPVPLRHGDYGHHRRFEVVIDQAGAMQRVRELLDAENWCDRRRREADAMLAAMVWAMDWRTGLITGVTREHLAARTGRSARTVSRLWTWAEAVGLLARVEQGAAAEWLGGDTNRAAAFVVVAPFGTAAAARLVEESAQVGGPVDKTGNLPVTNVEDQPLGRPKLQAEQQWPARGAPATPGAAPGRRRDPAGPDGPGPPPDRPAPALRPAATVVGRWRLRRRAAVHARSPP